MAPTLDVQIRDLVAMTRNLSGVTNAFVGIKKFMTDTHIAHINWPAAGWDAAAAYKQASSTAEDAAGAVHDASDSTAKNLDAVARHYADAEYHSSITPGSAPSPHRANSGSGVTADTVGRLVFPAIEVGVAAQVVMVLARARESVQLTARPAGLLPIFLAIDAALIEPNVRGSGPFREARDTWNAIARNNIKPLREDLEKLVPIRSWDGEAAGSFNTHMRSRFLPVLEELESLAGAMGGLCDEMATGMDEINKDWLALLFKAAFMFLILSFIPLPLRPTWTLVALGIFVGDVLYLYWKMRGWFSGKAAAVHQVQKRAAALAAGCFDDTQALEDNRNRLKPRFTMVSDDWTADDWARNWHYRADA